MVMVQGAGKDFNLWCSCSAVNKTMDLTNDLSLVCNSKKYACEEEGCNASYTKPFKLEIHKRKHSGERPFVCDVGSCTNAYTNMAHLKRHKCFVHEQSSQVLCPVNGCKQVYNNKYSLRKHLNQHHDNMFKCTECSQEFKKKCQLKHHLYLHTGAEALHCSLCNISFGSLHLYNKHKRNHKTYTCDCGSVFNRWTEFCEHRRKSCSFTKAGHKCIICEKVFTTKTNLRVHSLIHLEESQTNVYRCPYLDCKRSYKYKKNLKHHFAVYHDEVNINCTEQDCDLVFSSKKRLALHVLRIHKGVPKKLPKKKKERKPRKDKGKRKECMASVMSGVPLPAEEHLAIINDLNSPDNDASVHLEKLPDNVSKKVVGEEIDKDDTVKINIMLPTNIEISNALVKETDNLFSSSEHFPIIDKKGKESVTILQQLKYL